MKIIKKIIYRWFNHFGYYHIADLVAEGNCGLCGDSIIDVLPNIWPYDICRKCEKKYDITYNCIIIVEEY